MVGRGGCVFRMVHCWGDRGAGDGSQHPPHPHAARLLTPPAFARSSCMCSLLLHLLLLVLLLLVLPVCAMLVLLVCATVDEHKRPVDIPFELAPQTQAERLRCQLAVHKREQRLAIRDRLRRRKRVRISLDGEAHERWAGGVGGWARWLVVARERQVCGLSWALSVAGLGGSHSACVCVELGGWLRKAVCHRGWVGPLPQVVVLRGMALM